MRKLTNEEVAELAAECDTTVEHVSELEARVDADLAGGIQREETMPPTEAAFRVRLAAERQND